MELLSRLFSPPASTFGLEARPLTISLLILAAIFATGVYAGLVYFCWKYRAGRSVDRSNPPMKSWKLETAWIGIPLLLAIGIFLWAARLYFSIFVPPPSASQVYVLGKQWMWKVYHPDGPAEINELHLARGEPVVITLASQDVVHDFYVPEFRLKLDAVPGKFTQLWMQPTRTGRFHILCSQFCGTDHSLMRGEVVVMEPEEFAKWRRSGVGASAPGEPGAALFHRLGCDGCHGPYSGARAPSLRDTYGHARELADGETVYADDSYIRESIMVPDAKVVAGYEKVMPSYTGRINEEEVVQLILYVRSLRADGKGLVNGGEAR